MQTDEPSRDKLPYRHSFPPVVIGVADHEPRQDEEEIDGQIAVVDSLIDVTCRKGFEHVKPDDHQRRYAAQSVEYVVVGFRICKCRRRDFCFRHGWLFLLLFGLNWLFTGCKYTKSAVQIGHEPHFSSLLPYFAGFAARLRPPSFAPLPFASAAPAPVPRPPASRPALRLCPAPVSRPPASRPCFASLLRVPALRSGPARSPSPAPLSTLPAPAQLAGLPVSSSPSRRASCSNTVITRSVRAAIVRSSL